MATHAEVVARMSDNHILKGPESLGWRVSKSQATFSRLTTIFPLEPG